MTDEKQPEKEPRSTSEGSFKSHGKSETIISQDPETGETVVSSKSTSHGTGRSSGETDIHIHEQGATAPGKGEHLDRMTDEAFVEQLKSDLRKRLDEGVPLESLVKEKTEEFHKEPDERLRRLKLNALATFRKK